MCRFMPDPENDRIVRCYTDWSTQYYELWSADKTGDLAPHLRRLHEFVEEAQPRTLLDAGCGPASFLRTLDPEKIDCYGFDLTPSMIDEGRAILAKKGVGGERLWVDDVVRFADRPSGESGHGLPAYDMIVCAGVLNHIDESDEENAVRGLIAALEPGGTLVLHARNAYFSLFTANRHSSDYVIDQLAAMKALKDRAGSERAALEAIEADWKSHFSQHEPPARETVADGAGYDDIRNRFHDPLSLQNLCMEAGLTGCRLVYSNYHPVPPMYAGRIPVLFRDIAAEMEKSRDPRGLIMASSFFVIGTRPGA